MTQTDGCYVATQRKGFEGEPAHVPWPVQLCRLLELLGVFSQISCQRLSTKLLGKQDFRMIVGFLDEVADLLADLSILICRC